VTPCLLFTVVYDVNGNYVDWIECHQFETASNQLRFNYRTQVVQSFRQAVP